MSSSWSCPGLRLVRVLLLSPRYVPPRVLAATLPGRGSLRRACRSQSSSMRFLPAVGYALDVLLHVLSPAVGCALLFFCTCLPCCWDCSFHPLWVRSSVIHHDVLDLRRLRLLVDSPLSLTGLLASCLQHHPVWSCSLHVLRVVWRSPSTTHSSPRAARVESVVFSRSCNAMLLSRALLLRSSWHSMSRPPWHSMALLRRFTRALVFDKLFARPRADPRVLFRTLLQSSAALARRCAGWSAGLTSPPASPPATVRGGHSASRDHSSSCSSS